VSFTATVCPASAVTPPAGSVQFVVDSANFGAAVALSGDDANHCASATSGSTSTLNVANSPHAVSGTFAPTDTNAFTGSNDDLDGGQVVNAPPPTATTTTATSSANPSTFGQPVTFTAKVCPSTGTTAPTGSVQFVVDGTN